MSDSIADRRTDIVLVLPCIDLGDQVIRRIIPVDDKHLSRWIKPCIQLPYNIDPWQYKQDLHCRNSKHRLCIHIDTTDQTKL